MELESRENRQGKDGSLTLHTEIYQISRLHTARSKQIYKKMLEKGFSSNLKSPEEIKSAYLSLVKGMDALAIFEEQDWEHAMEQFQIADCTILMACVEKFASKEANLSLLDNKSNNVWMLPSAKSPPVRLTKKAEKKKGRPLRLWVLPQRQNKLLLEGKGCFLLQQLRNGRKKTLNICEH